MTSQVLCHSTRLRSCIPIISVKLFVCGDDFLEVFVEAVRVGDGHSVDGLFPSGDFPAFDKAAG